MMGLPWGEPTGGVRAATAEAKAAKRPVKTADFIANVVEGGGKEVIKQWQQKIKL